MKITVNSNWPKLHTSHPLNFHRLYMANFKFEIYLPGLSGSLLSSATPSYPLPQKMQNIKTPEQTILDVQQVCNIFFIAFLFVYNLILIISNMSRPA